MHKLPKFAPFNSWLLPKLVPFSLLTKNISFDNLTTFCRPYLQANINAVHPSSSLIIKSIHTRKFAEFENETFWVIFKHCVAIKQWKFEVFKILQMSKLNRWLAHFQQHMCDMDPTIKLNTSFFQLATIFLLCLLEDLIFYSRTPRRPARCQFFNPFFPFKFLAWQEIY